MEIKNKVAIVTGASQGIGLAVAKLLASKGAKVVLAARSSDTINSMEKELPGSFAVATDMRKTDDIKNMVQRTLDKYGRIDILINNAGQGMYGPIESVDVDGYRDIMELNVYGPLIAIQEVIPHMRRQGGGMILNVSSRVSKNYFPNLGAYASTKYALNAISLTARQELAKDNIVVSVMHPKMTATNFGRNSIRTAEFQEARPGDRPQMQVDTPEQVAEKIVGLISSEESEAEM
jgi:short-subunit dehydrogenase